MNQSTTLLYVMERAKAEAKHRGNDDICIEDVFLGILNLESLCSTDPCMNFSSDVCSKYDRKSFPLDIRLLLIARVMASEMR